MLVDHLFQYENENEYILRTCVGEMTIYNKTYRKDYK